MLQETHKISFLMANASLQIETHNVHATRNNNNTFNLIRWLIDSYTLSTALDLKLDQVNLQIHDDSNLAIAFYKVQTVIWRLS